MSVKKDFPSKGILKVEHGDGPNLGGYNLFAKRASFKDNVILQHLLPETMSPQPVIEKQVLPIALDTTDKELTQEELRKELEFKEKRLKLDLEAASGLDLKDILGHRVSISEGINEDDEDEVSFDVGEETSTEVSISQQQPQQKQQPQSSNVHLTSEQDGRGQSDSRQQPVD